jgi:hypothetical protein
MADAALPDGGPGIAPRADAARPADAAPLDSGPQDAGAAGVDAAVCVPETCDGLDEDCDGELDEDFDVGLSCVAVEDGCELRGVFRCVAPFAAECLVEAEPPELCNERDDDCDGETDEGYALGEACEAGLGRCFGEGTTVCGGGMEVVCSADVRVPTVELCNSLDDDCDGTVDEEPDGALDFGKDCEAGVGACLREGLTSCPGDRGGVFFEGIQQDLPEREVLTGGFELCYRGFYDDPPGPETALDDILAACDGEILMMGCRPEGAEDLTLAAMGERAVVLTDLGDERAPGNLHNGANWYFARSWSWGFAPPDAGLHRETCDVAADNVDRRMCWHTAGGTLNGGYRCGARLPVGVPRYERLIYHRDGTLEGDGLVCDIAPGEPAPEACNVADDDCDGVVDEDTALGGVCDEGVGFCEAGTVACSPEGPVCDVAPRAGSAEACNGVDDDCDGETDEGLGAAEGIGAPCEVGVGACARAGEAFCPPDAGGGLFFSGVQQALPERTILDGGFERCWTGRYADPAAESDPIDDILAACDGDVLLMGCGEPDAATLRVAAMGERDAVLADTGDALDPQNAHNDVSWYFARSWSWGFGPTGEPMHRRTCDTEGAAADRRMCWHTAGGRIDGGYRCGDRLEGAGSTVERRIYHRRGTLEGSGLACDAVPGAPAEETCNGVDDDCDGAVDEGTELGAPCEDGVGFCEAGTWTCDADGPRCEVSPRAPSDEVCNGRDDDCDGETDEALAPELGVGGACTSGVGACETDGALSCPAEPVTGLRLEGVQRALPEDALLRGGFEPCWSGLYHEPRRDESIADILEACDGPVLAMACRPVGSETLTVAAMGARSAVLLDTGDARDPDNTHNGVRWYFDESWSWGFAPAGVPLFRLTCDTALEDAAGRMCWHTAGGGVDGGLRCGEATPNADAPYERLIYHRGGRLEGDGLACDASPGEPGDEICNAVDDDCDGAADEGLDCPE